ncbi:hypothetical protein E2C01_078588 [Portunus trituberculatus]|uniref:Uncharacterized protein n=1 Tax=Portunus trituberculatus TaxID=210409 RepID=A0A5B7IT54_PORTR|nr:hypothetical protein [Portunus trituberculatus]
MSPLRNVTHALRSQTFTFSSIAVFTGDYYPPTYLFSPPNDVHGSVSLLTTAATSSADMYMGSQPFYR